MKIVFTKHALGKFKHPSIIKLGIKRKHIKSALANPDYSAEIPERRVMFILKRIDAEHDLRVIYRGNGAIEDMRKLKIKYESEDDVLNIWLSKKLYDYAEDENGVITHYTKDGEPVYIEILDASRFFKKSSKNIASHPSIAHRIK